MKIIDPSIVTKQAKKLKDILDVNHARANEILAQMYGYKDLHALQKTWDNKQAQLKKLPNNLDFLRLIDYPWPLIDHYLKFRDCEMLSDQGYPHLLLAKLKFLPAAQLFTLRELAIYYIDEDVLDAAWDKLNRKFNIYRKDAEITPPHLYKTADRFSSMFRDHSEVVHLTDTLVVDFPAGGVWLCEFGDYYYFDNVTDEELSVEFCKLIEPELIRIFGNDLSKSHFVAYMSLVHKPFLPSSSM